MTNWRNIMKGYCSNSPLRCKHALSMAVLNPMSNYCPECGYSLVPKNNLDRKSKVEQQFLNSGLCLAVLLLAVVYISYVNFV